MLQASKEHGYAHARRIRAMDSNLVSVPHYLGLKQFGIDLRRVNRLVQAADQYFGHAYDSQQPLITTPSIATPVQFLQNWLPGFVRIVTGARKADELAGLSILGAWEDEQVVQSFLELTAEAQIYGDFTNTPLASWNINFLAYTVVRFEMGLEVTNLEQARASRVQIDTALSKRESCALALEIIRNSIAFFGFNAGNNRTYGYLTDPNLPSYNTIAAGASSSTTWALKTAQEIINDIIQMVAGIETQTQDLIDPETYPMVFAIATSTKQYLNRITDFGYSVKKWMEDNYKNMRVVSAPELEGAHSSQNVMYMYPEDYKDLSTDNGRIFEQVVPAKFMVEGVQPLVKGYLEGYTNATAGCFVKRPWTVYRAFGN